VVGFVLGAQAGAALSGNVVLPNTPEDFHVYGALSRLNESAPRQARSARDLEQAQLTALSNCNILLSGETNWYYHFTLPLF
jgi:hypothetical protein